MAVNPKPTDAILLICELPGAQSLMSPYPLLSLFVFASCQKKSKLFLLSSSNISDSFLPVVLSLVELVLVAPIVNVGISNRVINKTKIVLLNNFRHIDPTSILDIFAYPLLYDLIQLFTSDTDTVYALSKPSFNDEVYYQ